MAKKMRTVTTRGTYLDQLKNLAETLAIRMDKPEKGDSLPMLAKQYRDTIDKIAELEGNHDSNDELSEILSEREDSGKPVSVRTRRHPLS